MARPPRARRSPDARARRAVFLDRDGTFLDGGEYPAEARRSRLLPGASRAIGRLNRAGLVTVVITNQSGVARGLLSEAALRRLHEALIGRLARRGARLDAIYYCPHHPTAGVGKYRRRCRCRKPGPGMILRARRDLSLDLAGSFLIGDSERDILAGRRGGVGMNILIARAPVEGGTRADAVVASLARAVDLVLRRLREKAGG